MCKIFDFFLGLVLIGVIIMLGFLFRKIFFIGIFRKNDKRVLFDL